jgi:hypothetical protein
MIWNEVLRGQDDIGDDFVDGFEFTQHVNCDMISNEVLCGQDNVGDNFVDGLEKILEMCVVS